MAWARLCGYAGKVFPNKEKLILDFLFSPRVTLKKNQVYTWTASGVLFFFFGIAQKISSCFSEPYFFWSGAEDEFFFFSFSAYLRFFLERNVGPLRTPHPPRLKRNTRGHCCPPGFVEI
jgi:hypothetical protein